MTKAGEVPQLVGSDGLISINRSERALRIARSVAKGAVLLGRSVSLGIQAYGAALATAWIVQLEVVEARSIIPRDQRDGIGHRFDRRP